MENKKQVETNVSVEIPEETITIPSVPIIAENLEKTETPEVEEEEPEEENAEECSDFKFDPMTWIQNPESSLMLRSIVLMIVAFATSFQTLCRVSYVKELLPMLWSIPEGFSWPLALVGILTSIPVNMATVKMIFDQKKFTLPLMIYATEAYLGYKSLKNMNLSL